jgi:hypothetical protein
MKTTTLIKLSAAIEAATGLAVIASPSLIVRLLFSTELLGGGVAIGRVGGIALLSLAIACWPGVKSDLPQITRSLFVYNLLAGLYLGFLRADHDFFSYLLLPAAALHLTFAILLARPALQHTDANKLQA